MLFRHRLLVLGAVVGALATACSSSRPAAAVPSTSAAEATAPAPGSADAELAKRVDNVLDEAVAAHRIVGAVVLVARDGRIVHHRAIGLRDREAGAPMREDTIFRYASVTKPIVSAAALRLVEQGKLRLDDRVAKWLPELHFRTKDGVERAITIEQLLTHTSGLGYGFLEPTDGPYHRAGVSDGLDHRKGFSLDENVRRLASAPLLFDPGSSFMYSLSDDVLGAVIERAAGEPLPSVVSRLVTRPLAMNEAAFAVSDTARLATPYADTKPEPKRMGELEHAPFGASAVAFSPSRILDAQAYPSGGAGMAGTARDFLALLEVLRKNDGTFLRTGSVDAMTTNRTGTLGQGFLGEGIGFGYGLSVVFDPAKAKLPVSPGTFQWGGAYGHNWWVDRAARLSVVVLTNTAFEGMSGALPGAIRAAVYGAT
jgi:CubicO group peptidase (beta-lactamase class C family)